MSDNADVGDVAPSSLAHLIGQRGVTEQVRVALDAAHQDGKKFDHSLLVGPPGLGKSAVARVVAQEMGTDFHEVLGQAVREPADLNALLLAATDRAVIHIDECHELGKEFQTALYLAMDQRRLVLGGGRSGKAVQTVPLADFTLLMSTTDEYALLQPLRDRAKLTLQFRHYSPADLATVVRQRCQALGWVVEPDVPPLVAERSRGTPGWRCGSPRRPAGCAGPRGSSASPPGTCGGPATWRGSTGSASARSSGSTSIYWPAGRTG